MNSTVTPSMARGVCVTPRLPPFVFDDAGVQGAWFGGDVGRTAAWNALSIVAGAGEQGIMDAGRWLVEHIDDPVVADETRRFVQQEAFHSTVHARLNRALASHGLPTDAVRDLVVSLMEEAERLGGRSTFLGAMLAGEQIIGEIGHALLERPDTFEGAPDNVRALWQWHFFEEVEHQAALHDGWTHVFGANKVARDRRVLGAAYALVLLIASWPVASWALVPAADRARRSRPSTWASAYRQMFGSGGLVRGAARNLTSLVRVDFHPFDMHDPVPMLDRLRDDLVDPGWERPMRAVPPGAPVERPPLAPVGLWDLVGLARFAAFAVRRSLLFMWTVK